MQAKRKTLDYLYNDVTKEFNLLLKLSGMPSSTFYRTFKILQEGGSLKRKVGSGRPHKFCGDERRRLAQLALKYPTFSGQNLAEMMYEKTGISANASTMRRTFARGGIKKKMPEMVPLITDAHRRKRLDFAGHWKNYHFADVFLSDECLFQLHRNKVKVWCRKSQRRPQKAAPKFSPKVMVWGALSFNGFYLKIFEDGTINNRKYCEIVAEFMPHADALYPNGWVLEQDGATPPTSKETKEFLAENNIQILQWPPNSPDINPVENAWTILKDFVEKRNPQTKEELIGIIQES